MLLKKILLAGFALTLVSATASYADTLTFTLNQKGCSSGCSVQPAGTVVLTPDGTNQVLVQVNLVSDYSFRNAPDSNHWGFVFNLPSTVTGVSVSNVTSGFDFKGAGTYKDAPFGNFDYAFTCPTASGGCQTGVPSDPVQTLSFLLTGTGLTDTSFTTGTDNATLFAVDVVGLDSTAGVGLTGNIGADGPGDPGSTPAVPEPSSLLLLGTGILGAAALLRRRLMA